MSAAIGMNRFRIYAIPCHTIPCHAMPCQATPCECTIHTHTHTKIIIIKHPTRCADRAVPCESRSQRRNLKFLNFNLLAITKRQHLSFEPVDRVHYLVKRKLFTMEIKWWCWRRRRRPRKERKKKKKKRSRDARKSSTWRTFNQHSLVGKRCANVERNVHRMRRNTSNKLENRAVSPFPMCSMFVARERQTASSRKHTYVYRYFACGTHEICWLPLRLSCIWRKTSVT